MEREGEGATGPTPAERAWLDAHARALAADDPHAASLARAELLRLLSTRPSLAAPVLAGWIDGRLAAPDAPSPEVVATLFLLAESGAALEAARLEGWAREAPRLGPLGVLAVASMWARLEPERSLSFVLAEGVPAVVRLLDGLDAGATGAASSARVDALASELGCTLAEFAPAEFGACLDALGPTERARLEPLERAVEAERSERAGAAEEEVLIAAIVLQVRALGDEGSSARRAAEVAPIRSVEADADERRSGLAEPLEAGLGSEALRLAALIEARLDALVAEPALEELLQRLDELERSRPVVPSQVLEGWLTRAEGDRASSSEVLIALATLLARRAPERVWTRFLSPTLRASAVTGLSSVRLWVELGASRPALLAEVAERWWRAFGWDAPLLRPLLAALELLAPGRPELLERTLELCDAAAARAPSVGLSLWAAPEQVAASLRAMGR